MAFTQRVADIALSEIASRPTVLDAAEVVARVYDFDKHPYFVWMREPTTRLEDFRASQVPYRYFVEGFSRALAAVLARVGPMEQRLATVYGNVAEEHGMGELGHSHRSTFVEYLKAIGVGDHDLEGECPIRVAVTYEALLDFALTNPPEMGAAALGLVEYTHIKIAILLAHTIHDRFWGNMDAQRHYQLHAEIDAKHASELLTLCDEGWASAPMRRRIAYAMAFGAQTWWSVFEALRPAEIIAASESDGIRRALSTGSAAETLRLIRRRHPRVRCAVPLVAAIAGGPPQRTVATSMNPFGVLLRATAPAPLDSGVEITLGMPGDATPLRVAGRVRSSAAVDGAVMLGVEFSVGSIPEHAALIEAIDTLGDAPPESIPLAFAALP